MAPTGAESCSRAGGGRVEVTGPRGTNGGLHANRFGSVAGRAADGAYLVSLSVLSDGRTVNETVAVHRSSGLIERLAVGLENLALDWLGADVARGEQTFQLAPTGWAGGSFWSSKRPMLRWSVADALGADGDVIDCTPPTHAADLGHVEAARLLLDAGADPSGADGGDFTPLMISAGGVRLEVLRLHRLLHLQCRLQLLLQPVQLVARVDERSLLVDTQGGGQGGSVERSV